MHFGSQSAVYIDTALLQTLSPRGLPQALAEVIKYGMLADLELFSDLVALKGLDANSAELPAIVKLLRDQSTDRSR